MLQKIEVYKIMSMQKFTAQMSLSCLNQDSFAFELYGKVVCVDAEIPVVSLFLHLLSVYFAEVAYYNQHASLH